MDTTIQPFGRPFAELRTTLRTPLSLSDLRAVVFQALAVYPSAGSGHRFAFWSLGTAAVAFVIWKSHRRRE